MNELNPIQMKALKYLLFNPKSRFKNLNTESLPTDHFSYHIKSLVDLNLIKKEGQEYSLTLSGKEFANRMDTDNHTIEKQPKVSVILVPIKIVKGIKYVMVQQRLKEPYYGYFGFMSGKVRYGETIFETAKRELKEETDLDATKFRYCYILHEMVYDMNGNILEDKFFNVVEVKNVTGKIKDAEGSKNFWFNKKQFAEMGPKYHNEDEMMDWYLEGRPEFREKKYYIESF
ncbi:MAG: NUDIX domain-containing protein [Candidatus Dojkabacteria bacterium]